MLARVVRGAVRPEGESESLGPSIMPPGAAPAGPEPAPVPAQEPVPELPAERPSRATPEPGSMARASPAGPPAAGAGCPRSRRSMELRAEPEAAPAVLLRAPGPARSDRAAPR